MRYMPSGVKNCGQRSISPSSMAWPYEAISSGAPRYWPPLDCAMGFSMTLGMACSSDSHDTAVAVPETADGSFGRTRVLLGFGDPPSHFHEGRAFRIVAGAALDEFVDATVF